MDRRKMCLVNWESITFPFNLGGLGILDLRNMNRALAVKWIYKLANSKEALWSKVVVAHSNGSLSSLIPSLANRGNKSALLGFVDSVIGRTGRTRKVVDLQFRNFIGDG